MGRLVVLIFAILLVANAEDIDTKTESSYDGTERSEDESSPTTDDYTVHNFEPETETDVSLTKINHVTKIKPPLKILDTLNPTNALSSSILYNREMNNNPDLARFSFLNITTSQERLKLANNYGISAVLSGDIFSLKSAVDSMTDSLCKNHSTELINGLLSGKMWALKMYDASAKSAVGLLWGSTFQLGNYDECLSIAPSSSEDNNRRIQSQYCLANIQYNKKKPNTKNVTKRLGPRDDIHWAICTPASCSSDQVQEFVSKLLLRSANDAEVTIPSSYCHKNKDVILEDKDIGFITFLSGFSIIVFVCTFYHIYMHIRYKNTDQDETPVTSAILSFSIARNLKKIFSVKQQNELGLDAIAGIKTISMIFILVGHALIFSISGPVSNTSFYDDMITRIENAPMLANPLLVDTFLLISAFLFCRLLLAELDKRNGRINVIPIYLFRYLRVTSSYIVIIAFYATLLDKIGEGPLWDSKMAVEKLRCQESWWANILYINNYVNTDNLCMFQSWYLSVDTQLFFLAPLIIYPLWRWRRVGEWLLLLTTVVTTLIPFVVTYIEELDPILMPFAKEVNDISQNSYFKNVYMKTHMKANTYCIGLCFGYILYRIQTSGFKLTQRMLTFGWIFSSLCTALAMFTLTIFYQPSYVYNPLEAAAYNSLHHIAWSIGNGWFLVTSATKNGGLMGKVFSWKPFIPLSRLTFCAYLVNGLVELNSMGTIRDPTYMSIYNLTILTFSHVIQTFVGALVLCLMFESPIHRIEKILLSTVGRKRDVESNPNLNDSRNKSSSDLLK